MNRLTINCVNLEFTWWQWLKKLCQSVLSWNSIPVPHQRGLVHVESGQVLKQGKLDGVKTIHISEMVRFWKLDLITFYSWKTLWLLIDVDEIVTVCQLPQGLNKLQWFQMVYTDLLNIYMKGFSEIVWWEQHRHFSVVKTWWPRLFFSDWIGFCVDASKLTLLFLSMQS